jgi:AraC family transcriptional regulator of arabinose operon
MPGRIINLSQVNLRLEHSPVHFGEVVYSPGGRCGPRRQRDYQLLILYSGELELHLDQDIIRMESGQSRLLHPRHREDFHFSRYRSTRHAWCSIKPEAVPAGLRRVLARAQAQSRWTPRLQRLFDMSRELRPMAACPLETERCLYQALHLLAEFARQAALENIPVAEQWLLKLDQFISDEYFRPLQLRDLARASGVSKQHLLRLCRLRQLPSPLEQLYRRRLENAADLLINTGLSIKEISEQCGFQSPFHFSRKFRQQNEVSPSDYRARKGC